MAEKKQYLAKVKALPSKIKSLAVRLKAWSVLRLKLVKAWFVYKLDLEGGFNKNGKTILVLGRDSMTSPRNQPARLTKLRSNFWTRLKNIVLLPWRYLFYGKIEL